jgi:hypothetical protein
LLHDLPVELMWGVGPVAKARLAENTLHREVYEPAEGETFKRHFEELTNGEVAQVLGLSKSTAS